MRKILILLFTMLMFITLIACKTTAEKLTINKKTYKEENIIINYPEISGMKDEDLQSAVNTQIMLDALELIQSRGIGSGEGASAYPYLVVNLDYKILSQTVDKIIVEFSGTRIEGYGLPADEIKYSTTISLKTGERIATTGDILDTD